MELERSEILYDRGVATIRATLRSGKILAWGKLSWNKYKVHKYHNLWLLWWWWWWFKTN